MRNRTSEGMEQESRGRAGWRCELLRRRLAERGSAGAERSIDSRRKAKAKESGEQRSVGDEKKGNGENERPCNID